MHAYNLILWILRHFGSNTAMTSVGSSPFVSPCPREDEELGPDAARASPANEGEPGEDKYPDAAWDHPQQIRTAEVVYLANEGKIIQLRSCSYPRCRRYELISVKLISDLRDGRALPR